MIEVLGVGDASMDIYLDVERIPGRDEKMLARRVEFLPGGMVANFVVALQRLGLSTGFHGPLGDDDFGRQAAADLALEGVDVGGVYHKANERTYLCTVLLDASGEKALVVAPTACFFPRPEEVRAELIAGARHVHTTAAIHATAARVLELAHAAGSTVSLDVEATALGQPDLEPLLAAADLLFANHRVVEALGAADPEDAARRLLERGAGAVCITLGASGVVVGGEEGIVHAPAFAVPVVDSTGAGDCFAAGFVYGWLRGWNAKETAQFAAAAAAIKVGRRGGHAGAATLAEVEAFLKGKGIYAA